MCSATSYFLFCERCVERGRATLLVDGWCLGRGHLITRATAKFGSLLLVVNDTAAAILARARFVPSSVCPAAGVLALEDHSSVCAASETLSERVRHRHARVALTVV